MMISLAVLVLGLLCAAMIWVGVDHPKLVAVAHHGAWLGLVASVLGVYCGVLLGISGALCVCVCAALVALPRSIADPDVRRSSLLFGGGWVLVFACIAVAFAGNTVYEEVEADEHLMLFSAMWALMSALMTMLYSALGASVWRSGTRSTSSAGVCVAVCASWVALALLGALRSGVPVRHFAIPLMLDGEPLMWMLPEQFGGSLTLGFEVTRAAVGVFEVLAASVLALIVVVWRTARKEEAHHKIWLWPVGCGLFALALIVYSAMSHVEPKAVSYMEHARVLGGLRRIPEEIVAQGGFATGQHMYVLWIDILPDMALGLLGVVLCASWMRMKPKPKYTKVEEHKSRRLERVGVLYARDLLVRACATMWMAWLLSMLTVWNMHASYGRASAHEWSTVGLLLWMTGLLLVAWGGTSGVRRLLVAVMIASMLCVIALGLGLGLLPMISIRY